MFQHNQDLICMHMQPLEPETAIKKIIIFGHSIKIAENSCF